MLVHASCIFLHPVLSAILIGVGQAMPVLDVFLFALVAKISIDVYLAVLYVYNCKKKNVFTKLFLFYIGSRFSCHGKSEIYWYM